VRIRVYAFSEFAVGVCQQLETDLFYLFNNDIKATTRNATPAQKTLPVRNQTTKAMMPAGKMKRNTFASSMIIIRPITRSKSKKATSISGPKTTNATKLRLDTYPYRFY